MAFTDPIEYSLRSNFRKARRAADPERALREDRTSLARSRATSRLIAENRATFDRYVAEALESIESNS